MSNLIQFKPSSPLSPFLGEWLLDPLSVSRNKVMKKAMGEDGLKRVWACASMQERAQFLAANPDLASRYQSVLRISQEGRMVVTPQAITFDRSQIGTVPARTSVYAITRVTAEGRKVIANTVDTRPERRGHPIGYVFRMQKQWLLVSEQYYGREAQFFPHSPVHRYYAAI
jgi:hypothetical protein